jgi:hypothetical protein
MSSRQLPRLLNHEDDYMLLIIGDAKSLFESPPSPPRVRILISPSFHQQRPSEVTTGGPDDIAVVPAAGEGLPVEKTQRRNQKRLSKLTGAATSCAASDAEAMVESICNSGGSGGSGFALDRFECTVPQYVIDFATGSAAAAVDARAYAGAGAGAGSTTGAGAGARGGGGGSAIVAHAGGGTSGGASDSATTDARRSTDAPGDVGLKQLAQHWKFNRKRLRQLMDVAEATATSGEAISRQELRRQLAIDVLLQLAADMTGIRHNTKVDPADGCAYPYSSFIEVYGVDDGIARWQSLPFK